MFLSAWRRDAVNITSLQIYSTVSEPSSAKFKSCGTSELYSDTSPDNVLG